MKEKLNSLSAKVGMLGALASVLTAAAFVVYGAMYNEYFDVAVLVCALLSAVGLAVYALKNGGITEYLNLAGVLCLSFGMGLFFLNSYPVWADWYGNFTMYGSRGGITPVIIILVLMLIALICGIISCFTRKEAK